MESELLKQQLSSATFDPELRPDPFEPLDHILDVAEEETLLPMLVQETEPAPKDSSVDMPRYYIHGFASFRLGRPEAAWPPVLRLAGKLEHGGHWTALSLLCGRGLDYAPHVDAALHVAKAFESAGFESLDPALLRKAYQLFPDECRLSFLMGEDRAREGEKASGGAESPEGKALLTEAYSYWAESLDGFVALKRYSQVEDVVLKIAGSGDPSVLRHVLSALRKLGEQNQWGRMEAAFGVALPALRKAGMVSEIWQILLKLLPAAPVAAGLRKWLSELATEAFPGADGIPDILNRSGILDPEVKVETAMKALDPLLAFAPGYFVLHASWGIGRIRLNDGETLILDFQEASNHRMSVGLARRALTVVPADDLRVQRVQDPGALKNRVKAAPADIVALAIRMLGGEAGTQEIKRALVSNEVLTASQWTTWWKNAKAAIEQDDRFDLSQAFRQSYRIRSATDDDALALPTILPRRGVRPNLNLIRRFLDQHPDETARAAQVYSSILQRWGRQERTTAEERMAIALQLHRWQRKVDDDFVDALRGILDASIEASTFADLEDQTLIVRVGLEHEKLWKKTACFALSSRYPDIRETALARLRQDPAAARVLIHELIEDPASRPMAALTAISLAAGREGKTEPFAPPVWDAAYGAALLAESTIREPIRKQAPSALGPKTTLAEMLLKEPLAETQLDRIAMLVRRWRSSERFLLPLTNILRLAGYHELVQNLREERMARTNQMLLTHAEQDALVLPGELMTRATFERIQREVLRLDTEMRTTLAQTIARARALGDLSENAEFIAAKQKQRDYSIRIANMSERLQRAKVIEEYEAPQGRIAPGTEVLVEDKIAGGTRIFWILGEGDDYHGAEVVSYAAPLGQALLGRRVGDHIVLPGDGHQHEYIVQEIRPRMPEAGAVAGSEAMSEMAGGPVPAAGGDDSLGGAPAGSVG